MLQRIGLGRSELRAWAMYDWANSAMAATIVTAVFPIYYRTVAAADLPDGIASQRYATMTTISLAIVAFLAPVLGTYADLRDRRKRFLAGFMLLGVASTACMFFIHRGDWPLASLLLILANIGASGSFVFYDSLLPHIARPDEIDRVSTAGYALGYLGGGLLLGLNLAWIQQPAWFGLPEGTLPARLAFLSVACWWLLFSIPLFRQVREPRTRGQGDVAAMLRQLRATASDFRRYRNAGLFLLAFLIFNDGILTIIRMATIYGSEIGIDQGTMIAVILLANFIGVPSGFAFGLLAQRFGAPRCLYFALAVFAGASFLGYRMQGAAEFVVLGCIVGLFLGGVQGLSRSLYASMIPKDDSSRFFGFFAVAEKFAGILGPALFAIVIWVTGSSRNAVLAIMSFFILGALLMRRVDFDEGRRQALTRSSF